MFQKKIGVIGGLGPFATMQLVELILKEAKEKGAKKDQDFPDIGVEIACSIPDRTSFLLGKTTVDPSEALVKTLRLLECTGCRVIGMPCNTAHAFWPALEKAKAKETMLVHMIDETVAHIHNLEVSNPVLLATDGTLQTELYHKNFRARNIPLDNPRVGSKTQTEVMDIIFGEKGVKAGFAEDKVLQNRLKSVLSAFSESDAVILGCTELPLLVRDTVFSGKKMVDPMGVLAKKMVELALEP